MPATPLGEESLLQQDGSDEEPTRGSTVIEYELIKQQEQELRAQAEHQRLVRAARTAGRTGWRPTVSLRLQRRTARPGEC
ncbi:hypothetical protein [Kitasatospora sp. NPDC008115]|uniref:hypothetical protein n=1 Tax=Kitasatospora sp. NPDC008115 TaxID=3364022 RepID=UPI0036EDEE0A